MFAGFLKTAPRRDMVNVGGGLRLSLNQCRAMGFPANGSAFITRMCAGNLSPTMGMLANEQASLVQVLSFRLAR